MRKRFFTNTIASLAYQVSVVVYNFIWPRLIIGTYGSEVNGWVASITQMLSLISLCDMGIGPVIKSNLYEPLLKKDKKRIDEIYSSASRFFNKIAMIFIAYVIALILLYSKIHSNSYSFIQNAAMITILSFGIFSNYFFGINNSLLLDADQRSFIANSINIACTVLNTCLCYITIKNGLNIYLVMCASACVFVARPILLGIYTIIHYHPNRKIKLKTEPIKQKWNGFALHLAQIVQDNTDVLVLTLFADLLCVSVYTVYKLVTNGLKMAIKSFIPSMSPILGKTIAQKDASKIEELFSFYEWIIHTTTSFVFSLGAIIIIPFIMIYTRNAEDTNYIEPVFGYLIVLCGFLSSLQIIYDMGIQTAGHFKQTQIAYSIEPVLNIIMSVILVKKYGLIGVAIGTAFSLVFIIIYQLIYLNHNVVNYKFLTFIKLFFVDALTIGLITLISRFFPVDSTNYLSLLISFIPTLGLGCLFVIAINLLFYRTYFKKVLSALGAKLWRKRV